jgi:hypothetical protein
MAGGSNDEQLRRMFRSRRCQVYQDGCLETAVCPTHSMITPHSIQGLDVVNAFACDKYKIGSVFEKDDLKDLLESMSQVAIVESL